MYPSREYSLFFSLGEGKGPYFILVPHNSTSYNPTSGLSSMLHSDWLSYF